jgi:hypothetical protein
MVDSEESMVRNTILTTNHETNSDAVIEAAIGNGYQEAPGVIGAIKNAAGR